MNFDGLVTMLVVLLFGPAIFFTSIGIILSISKKRKGAKIFYILAVVYVIISLGICGIL